MRTSPPTEAIEQLLCALYEGTASHGPWIDHNGAAWEMGDLAYDETRDEFVPYHDLLCTRASAQTRDLTRQAALAVRRAADRLLALLEAAHSRPGKAAPGPARGPASGDRG